MSTTRLFGSGSASGPRCYFTEADSIDPGPGWVVAKFGLTKVDTNRERAGDIPKRLCVP